MREHYWGVRWRNRILSLFLAAVMVFTLMPGNALTVKAAGDEDEGYWVGFTSIGDQPATGDNEAWEWDGENTLTFHSSWTSPNTTEKSCIKLPAGSTIVLGDGVDVEVTGKTGIYCEGDLTIIGNGELRVYANRENKEQAVGDESVIICGGKLVIGEDDDKTRPYLYTAVNDTGVSGKVLTLTSQDHKGASDPVVEIKSGQVSFSASVSDERIGKIWTANGKEGYVRVSGNAVLRDPSVKDVDDNATEKQCDNCTVVYEKFGAVSNGGYFFGSDKNYRFVHYVDSPRNLYLRIPVGSYLDLTVTVSPNKIADGKAFLGWNTDPTATTPMKAAEAKVTNLMSWTVLEPGEIEGGKRGEKIDPAKELSAGEIAHEENRIILYPIYTDKLPMPEAKVDYENKKLTDLIAGGEYEITVDGVSIVGKSKVTANNNGEVSIPNLDQYDGKEVVIKQIGEKGAADSDEQTITLDFSSNPSLDQEATPTAKVDYTTEKITDLVPNANYEITVDGVKNPVQADAKGETDLAPYYGKTISIVKKGTGQTEDSEEQPIKIKSKPAALDKDEHKPYVNEEGKTVVDIGADEEYHKKPTDDDKDPYWTSGPATAEIAEGETIEIRKKETEEEAPSAPIEVTKDDADNPSGTTQETTPTAKADYTTEKITGLVPNANYEITVDGVKNPVQADAKGETDLAPYYGKTISIVKKGTGQTEDSKEQPIKIKSKPAALDKDEHKPYVNEEGKTVVDIGADEEYHKKPTDDDKDPYWTSGPATAEIAEGETIEIRKKETADEAPSNPIEVTKDDVDDPSKTTQEATPTAEPDYTTEKITGLVPNANYEITVDGVKNPVQADAKGETDLASYYGKTISIVKKGTGQTEDSEEQPIKIKSKPVALDKDEHKPYVNEEGKTVVDIGADEEYHKKPTDDDKDPYWVTGPATAEIAEGETIEIRKKETTDEAPSAPIEVSKNDVDNSSKTTQETTPSAKADYTTEKITNLVPNAQYVITVDGKENPVQADAKGEIGLAPYYGKTISIVKKGNGTTTTNSTPQSLTITAKPAAPTAPSESKFDVEQREDGNVVIKNITSDMEYSLDDGKTWKPGTGGDLVVPIGTSVQIRTKATGTSPASEPVVINTISKATSVEAMEKMITQANTDKDDVKGSTFSLLQLKGTGKSTSIKLTWKKVKGANGYIVYGAACGEKMKKLKTIKGASKVSYTHKKLKAGKFYKYMVVAYKTVNGQNISLATSKGVHVSTTKNAKYGNPKKVKAKTSKITLNKGKSKTIKASYTLTKPKKEKIHIAKFRYESSNTAVATVTKKGKVKGIKAGKATIYVYAQNGVYAKVKVTVK